LSASAKSRNSASLSAAMLGRQAFGATNAS
jgi:hypothetical protein